MLDLRQWNIFYRGPSARAVGHEAYAFIYQ